MSSQDSTNLTIVLVFAGMALLALVGIVGAFVVAHRGRLLTHAERMKPPETGRELPDNAQTTRIKAASQAWEARQSGQVGGEGGGRSVAAQCDSTTIAACGSGFVFARLAATNRAVALAIASATGAVGVTGLDLRDGPGGEGERAERGGRPLREVEVRPRGGLRPGPAPRDSQSFTMSMRAAG